MNLLDLFVRIGVRDEASEQVEGLGSKLRNGLATAGKVAAAGIAAATTAVATLTGASLGAYASYEQLVGGVETLFLNSAETVKAYADVAYKTAGMSANNYMETVTSFSASLLQGLGGDTAAAAEVANQAIVDMSDNANKMGTDIASIQYAYQGFAKQNYTMLDNLKLGYGGTQAEMARLINESGVLGDTMTVTAETVNQVSFDKIIEAIHKVQDNLGITGTTAKEASTTIEGSVNSAKAAWTNLITGLADDNADLDGLIGEFISSAETAAGNIIPRVEKILGGIGAAVEKIAPIIAEQLPKVIESTLPSLAYAGTELALSLIDGFAQSVPAIISALPGILGQVGEAIGDALGFDVDSSEIAGTIEDLASTFYDLLPAIAGVTAAVTAYKTAMGIAALIQGVSQAITAFKTANNAATIAQAALNAVMNLNPFVLVATLVAGLVVAIITLWNTNEDFRNAIINIWGAIQNAFSAAWEVAKELWSAAGEFFSGVWEAIKSAFSSVSETMGGFFSSAFEKIKIVFSPAIGYFQNIWDTIKGIFSAVKAVLSGDFQGAWDAIKGVFSGWAGYFQNLWGIVTGIFSAASSWFYSVGSNIVSGIWSGISSMGSWLSSKVTGFFSGIVDGVKSFLGIHSPSRVFAGIGGYMAEGLGVGWDDEYSAVKKNIERGLDFDNPDFDPKFPRSGGGRSGGVGGGSISYGTVNFTINAKDGQSAKDIAKEVAMLLEIDRERAANAFA